MRKIIVVFSVFIIFGCSAKNSNKNEGSNNIGTNISSNIKDSVINKNDWYWFIGKRENGIVFKNTKTNDLVVFKNNAFEIFDFINHQDLIYINNKVDVHINKGEKFVLTINHNEYDKKVITVANSLVLFNIDENSKIFPFQESGYSDIKFVKLDSKDKVELLGISGYIPIVRDGFIYFGKTTKYTGLFDLFIAELNNLSNEKKLIENIYEEGLQISEDNKFIITAVHTIKGKLYVLYDIQKELSHVFNDVTLNDLYPVFLQSNEIMFYNPKGLDYRILKIPEEFNNMKFD